MAKRVKPEIKNRPTGYKPPKEVMDSRLLDTDRMKSLIDEFDKIDLNKDGILTKQEIEEFMKKNLKIKGIGKRFLNR
jgi:Ca2+-binding EF-hand superfamily protein